MIDRFMPVVAQIARHVCLLAAGWFLIAALSPAPVHAQVLRALLEALDRPAPQK